MALNVYLFFGPVLHMTNNNVLQQHQQHSDTPLGTSKIKENSGKEIYAPYGIRSEIISRYENGKWKTYATTTPMHREDLKHINDDFIKQEKMMQEYFDWQDRMMRHMWNTLWW